MHRLLWLTIPLSGTDKQSVHVICLTRVLALIVIDFVTHTGIRTAHAIIPDKKLMDSLEKNINLLKWGSSIGRVFRSPLWRVEENGGPSASGRHLGWPHFRFPQMRSPKMATGSGRAAIFLHPPQQGSKNAPQVLDDVISGAAILDSRWRRWKWRLEDVETPVKTSYRRLPHPWVL